MKANEGFNAIFNKYLEGVATQQELQLLMDYFQQKDCIGFSKRILEEFSKEELDEYPSHYQAIADRVQVRLDHLHGNSVNCNPKISLKRSFNLFTLLKKPIAVAATVLAFGIFSTYLIHENYEADHGKHSALEDVILPSHNEACILFEDGVTYSLSDLDAKLLAKRGIQVTVTTEGDTVFNIIEAPLGLEQRQTFYSPKGSMSRLVLVDGTQVWLNSGSTISYPTRFTESNREVTIDGEVYFDVTHNALKPFVVTAKSTQVNVLGTKFNVATNLANDNVLTTLVEGSVEVKVRRNKLLINPGTQAITNQKTGIISSQYVHVHDVIAWKDGKFKFREDDIYTVLEKIQTWYNIKDYQIEESTHDRFSGTIVRTKKLSDLLNQLEKISNYRFNIREGRVYVMR